MERFFIFWFLVLAFVDKNKTQAATIAAATIVNT